MSQTPAFSQAQQIELSLELLVERCDDPTPHVYARLFAAEPRMEAHFWRDTNGAVRGEMLSRAFEAILDFVGERHYAQHMIGTEMVTHEGYDIPREIFITFFGVIRDTVRDLLGADWTPAFEAAWADLLAELHAYTQTTPRAQATAPYFAERIAEFEAEFLSRAR